jgi:pyruvate formate lyase activating enzyme
MMDLKHMSPEAHREATGNTNERILANAQMLAMSSKRIIFRTPVIPAVNDTPEAIRQIVEFIGELIALRTRNGGASGVGISYELLTFHKLGSDKYRNLGVDYRAAELTPPTRQQMQALVEVATAAGLDTTFR